MTWLRSQWRGWESVWAIVCPPMALVYLGYGLLWVLAGGCAKPQALKNPGVTRVCPSDICFIYFDERSQVEDKCSGRRGNRGKYEWDPDLLRFDSGRKPRPGEDPPACTFYRPHHPKHRFYVYLWRFDPVRREAHEACHIDVWRIAEKDLGNGYLGDHSKCDGLGFDKGRKWQ